MIMKVYIKVTIIILQIPFIWILTGCDDDDIMKDENPSFEMATNVEINGTFTTDVWGYQISGNEYVIVGNIGNHPNFSIIDVTDPENPQLVSQTDYSAFDMKVWQNYLYVVDGHRDQTVQKEGAIYDISNPASPVLAGNFPSCHNIFIDDQGFLYLSGRNEINSNDTLTFGLSIYSLDNPVQPALLWTSLLDPSHDITVIGDRMYDFHKVQGTNIYDVSNRSNPILLSTINPQITTYDHSGWPTENGQYLFITNEFSKTNIFQNIAEGPDITIYNIADPKNPVQVGQIHDDSSRVHNLYIIKTFAYVSYYGSGFKIYDINDPTSPEVVYTFDTNIGTDARAEDGFQGAFGVYPFSSSGNVYVTDIQKDLFIFKRTN